MPRCRVLKNYKNFQSGFSLVELILVVMVVGFIVVLFINLPNSIGLIGKSHNLSLAKDIARQEIEDVRSQSYDNLADGTVALSDARLSSLNSGSAQEIISDCPVSICPNNEQLKQVLIEVDWKETGISKNIRITTFVAKNGLK
jgi:prepilin-type N-terminal cleavage/methylation domain-containing protein